MIIAEATTAAALVELKGMGAVITVVATVVSGRQVPLLLAPGTGVIFPEAG